MRFSTLYFFGIEAVSSKSERDAFNNIDDWVTNYYDKDGETVGTSKSILITHTAENVWITTYYGMEGDRIGTSESKYIRHTGNNNWVTIYYNNEGNEIASSNSERIFIGARDSDWITTYYDHDGENVGTAQSVYHIENPYNLWLTEYYFTKSLTFDKKDEKSLDKEYDKISIANVSLFKPLQFTMPIYKTPEIKKQEDNCCKCVIL
jgi:hypothetical protein